jgi:hypothetical protein
VSLRDVQMRFAAHIRDPAGVPRPADVEDRRMSIYRELFLNNVMGLLGSAFPVLRQILGPERWAQMVRDFYRDHRCRTPLFLEVSQEFLTYLGAERAQAGDDPPFLYELAHYEWVELALSIDEASLDELQVDRDGNLLEGVPVLSPVAWPLVYDFPVHQLSPQFQPLEPPAERSFYIVCRDRLDKVGFMRVNAVTLRLFEMLREHPDRTGRAQLASLADELPLVDRSTLLAGGAEALQQLRSNDAVLGTRRT